jgi:hypothetical protein
MNWRERAIAQSRSVDRSRTRSLGTIENLVSSARALVIERAGGPFTTQELVERSGTSLQTEVEEAQRGYVDLVREVLQAMIDADRIAPRNTLETDAQLITYLVRATYQAMITSGANDDRATVAHHVTAFCLHAVGLRDAIPRRPHAAPAERPTYRRHDGTTGVAAVSATDRGPR